MRPNLSLPPRPVARQRGVAPSSARACDIERERDVYPRMISVIRVGELFREAVKHNCAALVVVHNHPSGDPTRLPRNGGTA
jgi:hypothetical protein